MSVTKQKYPNHLTRYRERLGFTQEQLASIVGCRRRQTIARIEAGASFPNVKTLLSLSAAVRVPVEFLYRETFLNIRAEVRLQEEQMSKGTQGILPLPA
jgi:DNA-binding XRE family transcriptional regulator